MGTVLDFELLSQCSMTWPCVVETCYGDTMLDFELLSQCSMVWPCNTRCGVQHMGTVLDIETVVSMFNTVPMCCRDVVSVLWVHHWILSNSLNVQWCGHVLWRCDLNNMGTVLDIEQQLNVQWCGHVLWRCDNTWVRCWILSCCLNVQHRGHVLSRCDKHGYGVGF